MSQDSLRKRIVVRADSQENEPHIGGRKRFFGRIQTSYHANLEAILDEARHDCSRKRLSLR